MLSAEARRAEILTFSQLQGDVPGAVLFYKLFFKRCSIHMIPPLKLTIPGAFLTPEGGGGRIFSFFVSRLLV